VPETLFAAAGPLRPAYEAVDWAATPLGPVRSWTPVLRAAADLALSTRFPVTLFWGPEHVLVYNAAFAELIADKHPAALGTPARFVFPEAWGQIGPLMAQVFEQGVSTWTEDAPIPLVRHGALEEAYFTFSYSPVRAPDGTIEGGFDIAFETTREVVGRRRLELLARLREALYDVDAVSEVPRLAAPVLRAATLDLPAVDVRLDAAAPTVRDPRLPAAPAGPIAPRGPTFEDTGHGRVVWLPFGPPLGRDAAPPVLVAALSPMLVHDTGYLEFLRLVTASLARALDRIRAAGAERALSEALQRSLLTRPVTGGGVQIAARYVAAAAQARIGGDWHDAFRLRDGTLMLVIGDVAGHDRGAAVAMAQVRNLLRGVAFTLEEPPGRVLTALDEAMTGLGVNAYATAVLARIEEPAGSGARTLRWSNAGHPPPVLVEPGGRARLLDPDPDPLLGLQIQRRTDHEVALAPGATVVLYTDGLVERRSVALDDSIAELVQAVERLGDRDPEGICDGLLEAFGDDAEDDIALLAVRPGP